MNLGLGNLTELKQQLLASSLQAQTNYDDKLAAIGSGVARSFDKVCNRKLERAVNDVFQFPGDRSHVVLPRYPVEAVSTVEFRARLDDPWTEQTGTILNLDEGAGQIFFAAPLGYWFNFVRVTYTGGYWFDTTEESTGAQPDGATKVPDDLKLAWYLQCRKVWESIDKQGTKVTQVGSGASFVTESLGGLDLVPAVKQVLNGYRRFAIT